MVDPDDDELEIDALGKQMLSELADLGGESNSKKLREQLDGVEHSPFHYRLTAYLEPLGLVETHQPEAKPGDIPPKEITLTDDGTEFLEGVEDTVGEGVEARLERLEQQLDTLQRENQELRSAIEQSGAGAVQDEIRGLRDEITSLQDRVRQIEQHPVIEKSNSPSVIDAALISGNTARVMLKDEYGEDTVIDTQEDVEQSLEENGSLFTE